MVKKRNLLICFFLLFISIFTVLSTVIMRNSAVKADIVISPDKTLEDFTGNLGYTNYLGEEDSLDKRNTCERDLFCWSSDKALYSSGLDFYYGFDGYFSRLYCKDLNRFYYEDEGKPHRRDKSHFTFTLYRGDVLDKTDSGNLSTVYPELTLDFIYDVDYMKITTIKHNNNDNFWALLKFPLKINGQSLYFDGKGFFIPGEHEGYFVSDGRSYIFSYTSNEEYTLDGNLTSYCVFELDTYNRFTYNDFSPYWVNNFFNLFDFYQSDELFPFIDIGFVGDSIYNTYFWNFEYSYQKYDKYVTYSFPKSLWKDNYHKFEDAFNSSCMSIPSSVYDLVNYGLQNGLLDIEENNNPTETPDDDLGLEIPSSSSSSVTESNVSNILNKKTISNVKFSYLAEIPGTPFAYRKRVVCDVSECNDSYSYLGAFADVLGVQNFKIFNSYPIDVKIDLATKSYEVVYPSSVLVNVKTISGSNKYLFLDCGQSFGNYYYSTFLDSEPPIIEGVDKTSVSSFFFNQFIMPYSDILSEFARENSDFELDMFSLYGFWGYMPVPVEHGSLSSIWGKIFSKNLTSSGLNGLSYVEGYLSKSSYDKLRNDFGYTWLEDIFDDLGQFLTQDKCMVNHYFFYGDSVQSYAYIGENGANNFYDNSSTIKNDIKDKSSNLWDKFKDSFGSVKSTIKTVLKIVVIVLALILIGIIISIVSPIFSLVKAILPKKKNKSKKK